MAADAYVQAAAGQLENGAVALKQEADQIRAEFMTYDRDMVRDIDDKEANRRALAARASTSSDSQEAASLLAQVALLRRQINKLQDELERRRSQTASAVKDKETKSSDLMGQARNLYGKASSMK